MKSTIHVVLSDVNDPARRSLIKGRLDAALADIKALDPEVEMRIHDSHEGYVAEYNPLCGHEAPVYQPPSR